MYLCRSLFSQTISVNYKQIINFGVKRMTVDIDNYEVNVLVAAVTLKWFTFRLTIQKINDAHGHKLYRYFLSTR